MKFTLKDYQEEAVGKILVNLNKGAKRWREDKEKNAFSLAAATGAGKTVMAAAVFEALFHGDDGYDFVADPTAAVIWFSDDPALNEQTRFRLLEASDRLDYSDLIVVENTFNRDKFEAGKIYFLNTQKLGKKSLLVRGHDSEVDESQEELIPRIKPDLRSQTIWDTIQNTIQDPNLTLYLVLDEAHRGMGKTSANAASDKSTIIKRLINGSGSTPAIPVVLGISATVERFNAAMTMAEGRTNLPNVVVDPAKVQASGLLKDTIILDIPEKVGKFDTVLVRRAINKLKDISKAWEEYADLQKDPKVVKPLMVVQVPNTPDHDEIGQALDTIFQEWEDLKSESIAHVLGEHKTMGFGNHIVPYISPERVQESHWVRILIAKDAISTGWDCPRAEVMLSFRNATDRTHITQLLGRMIRSPLARRISGNDRLNSVDCILPFFDTKAVETVAEILMKGGDDDGSTPMVGRRVLIHPKEMFPHPNAGKNVWEKFTSLPTQTLPQRGAKPVKRLTALAQELASDGLVVNAGKQAHAHLHKVLDAANLRYEKEISDARKNVLTVEGKSLKVEMESQKKSFDDFLEDADFHVIEDAFKRAARIISPDLARTYAEYLAEKTKRKQDSPEEALIDAHTDIAAMGLVPDLQEYLDAEAEKLTSDWLNQNRVKIKDLTDDRQEAYRTIRSWSKEPQSLELAEPKSWMVATIEIQANGKEVPLPHFKGHLLCDKDDGSFPCELNNWEAQVLSREIKRSDFKFWYRNPSRPSQDSLGAAYTDNDRYQIVRPDFLFFSIVSGKVVVDIVDPHGLHLGDALAKLKGLAQYAEENSNHFRRIESIAEVSGKLRVIDLSEAKTRKQVLESDNAKSLFDGDLASDY
jgi:type III restriction enzyme